MIRHVTLALLLSVCAPALLCAQSDRKKELDDNYQKFNGFFVKGKWTEGLPYIKRAAELAPEVFGDDHPNTGALINSLGVAFMQSGRRAEAEKSLREALAIREK